MAGHIELTSLHCVSTEDNTGSDEVYLLRNGDKVWNGELNDGQGADLKHLGLFEFGNGEVRLELWDEDVGGLDNDDKLGEVTFTTASPTGSNNHTFGESGGDVEYVLGYTVGPV